MTKPYFLGKPNPLMMRCVWLEGWSNPAVSPATPGERSKT